VLGVLGAGKYVYFPEKQESVIVELIWKFVVSTYDRIKMYLNLCLVKVGRSDTWLSYILWP